MAASAAFEAACGELERAARMDKWAARGTLQLTLMDAGLETASVTPGQLSVVVERLLPRQLQSHGVTTTLAVKIYKTYGDDSIAQVQQDPYRLARDIRGVGFNTADKIARDLGLPANHPTRIEAGIVYALNQAVDEGHVFLPQPDLVDQAAELLSVTAPEVEAAASPLRISAVSAWLRGAKRFAATRAHVRTCARSGREEGARAGVISSGTPARAVPSSEEDLALWLRNT